jgi:hypothetical protein
MAEKTKKERSDHWLAICKGHRITKPQKIAIDLSFTQNQFEKIKQGFLPEAMEDKWVIYYSRGTLYFHRSWTGYRIYTAKMLRHKSGYAIREFYVERNADIYSNTDDKEDVATITFLIANLLGVDASSIFAASKTGELGALQLWSNFGRMFFRPDSQLEK